VATLARPAATPVTRYADVELVSLLVSDFPRARPSWPPDSARWQANAEPAERLGETVLAFIAAGGSPTRVAKQLSVHQNTVSYRVKRAEELLGRRLSDEAGRADLRARAHCRPRRGGVDRGRRGG
jgi:sugar diacid utilization regulator